MNLPEFRAGYFASLVSNEDNKVELDSRSQSEYLHVSSLLRGCARATVLQGSVGPELKTASGADRVVWTMGRAAEKHFRDQFIARVNFQGVVGVWTCNCGGLSYRGLHADAMCQVCGSKANNYEELTLRDDDAKIIGNPDMLYICPGLNKLVIVEIKSLNKREFDLITEAKADHVHQASAYLKLASNQVVSSPDQMHDHVVVVYICKDYIFAGSIYREYHVPYSRAAGVIELIWGEARVVKLARASCQLPPRLPACSRIEATTAKNCKHCVTCFSRS